MCIKWQKKGGNGRAFICLGKAQLLLHGQCKPRVGFPGTSLEMRFLAKVYVRVFSLKYFKMFVYTSLKYEQCLWVSFLKDTHQLIQYQNLVLMIQ